MNGRLILGQDQRVGQFVADITGNGSFTNNTTIGWERNGVIVAGVVYDSFTGANCSMHVASDGSRRWMSREFLFATFNYPFNQLNLRRVTGVVERANTDALRFDYHLGFEDEAVLKDASPSGDLLLLVIWRHKCRWWNGATKLRQVA